MKVVALFLFAVSTPGFAGNQGEYRSMNDSVEYSDGIPNQDSRDDARRELHMTQISDD